MLPNESAVSYCVVLHDPPTRIYVRYCHAHCSKTVPDVYNRSRKKFTNYSFANWLFSHI